MYALFLKTGRGKVDSPFVETVRPAFGILNKERKNLALADKHNRKERGSSEDSSTVLETGLLLLVRIDFTIKFTVISIYF